MTGRRSAPVELRCKPSRGWTTPAATPRGGQWRAAEATSTLRGRDLRVGDARRDPSRIRLGHNRNLYAKRLIVETVCADLGRWGFGPIGSGGIGSHRPAEPIRPLARTSGVRFCRWHGRRRMPRASPARELVARRSRHGSSRSGPGRRSVPTEASSRDPQQSGVISIGRRNIFGVRVDRRVSVLRLTMAKKALIEQRWRAEGAVQADRPGDGQGVSDGARPGGSAAAASAAAQGAVGAAVVPG